MHGFHPLAFIHHVVEALHSIIHPHHAPVVVNEASILSDHVLHASLAEKSPKAMRVAMWPPHRPHPTPARRRIPRTERLLGGGLTVECGRVTIAGKRPKLSGGKGLR